MKKTNLDTLPTIHLAWPLIFGNGPQPYSSLGDTIFALINGYALINDLVRTSKLAILSQSEKLGSIQQSSLGCM